MKILILKPSSLGDVIHALPVLRLIRQHLPQSEIYWWIDTALEPLLENDPDLTGTIRFERKRWACPRHWPELWSSIRQARRLRFDWVIDLQSLARSALFGWLANGKLNIGLDDSREGARGAYDLVVSRPSANAHAVDWYLSALPVLGVPVHFNFKWLPERPGMAEQIRHKWGTNGSRWILLKPGARWLNKRWPAQHFIELIGRLSQKYVNYRFAVMGDASDRELGHSIARVWPNRCLDLTGQTSLAEMIEWIRLGDLIISNDTGPMHVAAALNKPVFALFGPTNPRRTGPYGNQHTVFQSEIPCVPCMKDYCRHTKLNECLRAISVVEVAERLEPQLDALDKSGRTDGGTIQELP